MNKLFRKTISIILGIMLILFLADLATAGQGRSISISIVIPEIPGINSPLIQEETTQTKKETTQNTQNLKENEEFEPPQTLEQEEKQETQLAENNSESPMIMRTLYSR